MISRSWRALVAEYRLLRTDFWASRHSGALLILCVVPVYVLAMVLFA